MRPLLNAPPFWTERFAGEGSQRLNMGYSLPLENAPTAYATNRLVQEATTIPFVFTWTLAMPLLLWAEQEEAQSDMGGTAVFILCCILVVSIFSTTGWRNEAPK